MTQRPEAVREPGPEAGVARPTAATSLLPGMRALFNLLGIDRAVGYVIFGRLLSVLLTPVTFFMIVKHLSAVEQGYYYTFGSVLGLAVFFELGLNYVIMQSASHEMAGLEWSSDGTLIGDPTAKQRLASLLRQSLVWYSVAAFAIALIILPLGLVFFERPADADVAWKGPWIWMVIASAGWCLASPMFSILTGAGLVEVMQRNGLIQQAGNAILLLLVLALGGHLYAAPIAATWGSFFPIAWLLSRRSAFVRDTWRQRNAEHRIHWRDEIWPMQWRVAVSAASGYLVAQLFNPILFKFWGAEAAGKMGMTLALTSALVATSSGWFSTRAPQMGRLVAQRKFTELDRLFGKTLAQSTLVLVGASLALCGVIAWLQHSGHPYGARILPLRLVLVLSANTLAVHLLNAAYFYLRAHKEEPLWIVSLAYGLCVAATSYYFGRKYGATGMSWSYLTSTVVFGVGAALPIVVVRRRDRRAMVYSASAAT